VAKFFNGHCILLKYFSPAPTSDHLALAGGLHFPQTNTTRVVKVPDDAYVKVETSKILKQHKAYMAQFEEMLNDEKIA